MYKLFYYCCIATILLCGSAGANNCTTLNGLVSNLYSTDKNLYELNRIFFPPRALSPSLVHVTYFFKNPQEDDTPLLNLNDVASEVNCSVNYVWAEGGFFFIQPPSIFELTSLLFNQRKGAEDELYLFLPWHCRELVLNASSGNDECTCKGESYGSKLLDMATHELKAMARYNDPVSMVRDGSQVYQSICEENLESTYHILDTDSPETVGVIIFFVIMLFLPLTCITLSATVVRGVHKAIHKNIVKPFNHKTVAGLVLMGMFITFFIFSCDVAAVWSYIKAGTPDGESELGIKTRTSKVGYFSSVVLLAVDSVGFFHTLLVLLYICFKNIRSPDKTRLKRCSTYCVTRCLSRCFYPYFFVVFSTLRQDKKQASTEQLDQQDQDIPHKVKANMELNSSEATLWVVTLAMAAPVLTISTHVGFVLVSWLTNSQQASSVALFYLVAVLFLFLMLRQCYNAHATIEISTTWASLLLFLYPVWQCIHYLHIDACFCFCINKCKKDSNHNDDKYELTERPYSHSINYKPLESVSSLENISSNKVKKFNTQAFCIAFAWGWGLMLSVGLVFGALAQLPIPTVNLLSNLLHTCQTCILFISLLVTYKIVSLGESDIKRFLKKLKKVYTELIGNEHKLTKNDLEKLDDAEAAACFVGEFAKVVVHQLPKEEEVRSPVAATIVNVDVET